MSPRNDSERLPGAATAPAFTEVYAAHFGFVWRCLRVLGVPDAGLDDAAQEVFVVVHRRLHEFRHESSLRTWLYGIVRNVAANQRRGERRKGGLSALGDELAALTGNPFEELQASEAADFVRRFMDALDDKKRDLFMLAMIEEMSMPEVAEILGIPLNTAYTRLRSVRLAFQAALAERRSGP